MAHTRTWDTGGGSGPYENNPEDADEARFGAQEIRNLKTDIRERLALEHYFVTSGGIPDAQGIHKANIVTEATASRTLGVTDDVVLCAYNAGNTTITIPQYNGATTFTGKCYRIVKTAASTSYAVTINFTGGDTADGITSLRLSSQYQFVELVNRGTATWWFRAGFDGWYNITPTAGWAATSPQASYGRDSNRHVRLKGSVYYSSGTPSATFYTIGVGYRPVQTTLFYAAEYSNGAYYGVGVNPDGTMVCAHVHASSIIMLDGMTYYV